MAKLNFIEKRNLEEFLRMRSGYVLDFSNRTFREFIIDSVGIDIYDEAGGGSGESKASRLRHFWNHQPDHIVGKMLRDLIELADADERLPQTAKCRAAADRLLASAPVPDAEVISTLSAREGFDRLAADVLDSINKNDPVGGLDRLHTFTIKFVRSLCEAHSIAVDRDKALHACFGEYVKKLKSLSLIESRMTETILKTSISVLDAFNDVRNNKSLAHDNPVLNHNEALLIFQHVTSAIRFLFVLEQAIQKPPVPAGWEQPTDEEIPF